MQIGIALAVFIVLLYQGLRDEEGGKYLGYIFIGLAALWFLKWALVIGFVVVVWFVQHFTDILGLMLALSGILVLFCAGRALGTKYDEFAENRAIRRRYVSALRLDPKTPNGHNTDDPRRRDAPFIDGL